MKMIKGERFWCHYEELEEFKHGLWIVTHGEVRAKYIRNSTVLMRDTERFFNAMDRASKLWGKSCMFNFTNPSTNKIAWLGQAGCSVEVGSPEDCTRAAWHNLTFIEQEAANFAAKNVLDEWELAHIIEPVQLDFLEEV